MLKTIANLEHVKKLLAKARYCVASPRTFRGEGVKDTSVEHIATKGVGASRAGGEEHEEYWKYFECSEAFLAQAATQYRSRQEFLNML
jgi:hypothetical protein